MSLLMAAMLILPWATGYCLLLSLRGWLQLNTFARLGYGYFLGATLLYLLQLSSRWLLGHSAAAGIATALLLLACAFALLAHYRPASIAPKPGDHQARHGWLPLLVMVAILLHLGLTAFEVAQRPVFPWDGWQTWMYKAGVWFHAGALAPLVNAADASRVDDLAQYAMPGANYPGLVPKQYLWAAQSLGEWREPAINWPNFLAGLALALGLAGQLRSITQSTLLAVLGAYLLLSMPLLATHHSLAGYADLWMAGFAGLGLTAILTGLLTRVRSQLLLGVTVLGAGLAVKYEGFVWLVLGLALLGFHYRPRTTLAVSAAGAGLFAAMWSSGGASLSLPLLGQVGLEQGILMLGPFGQHALSLSPIAGPYLQQLFLFGNWHLLWYLLAGMAAALLVMPQLASLRLPLGVFLGLVVTSQAIIFGCTAAGAWALDGTALNRVLLHVTAPLVFCLLVTAQRLASHGGKTVSTSLKVLTGALLAGLLASVAVAVAWHYSAGQNAAAITWASGDLRAVYGEAREEGDQLRVTQFMNGRALISTGKIARRAERLTLLTLDTGGDNRKERVFFWRTATTGSKLHSLRLSPQQRALDLSADPRWRGVVTELGLMFFDNDGRSAQVRQIALRPPTLLNTARTLLAQWLQFEPWSATTINAVAGGAANPMTPLPLVVACGLLLAALGLRTTGRGSPREFLVLALLSWLLLDGRWLWNRVQQAAATSEYYTREQQQGSIDVGNDSRTQRLARGILEHLPDSPQSLVILSEKEDMRFERLRMKYALLPHAAHTSTRSVRRIVRDQNPDYVLLVTSPYPAGGANFTEQALEQWRRLSGNRSLEPALVLPEGVLFRP